MDAANAIEDLRVAEERVHRAAEELFSAGLAYERKHGSPFVLSDLDTDPGAGRIRDAKARQLQAEDERENALRVLLEVEQDDFNQSA